MLLVFIVLMRLYACTDTTPRSSAPARYTDDRTAHEDGLGYHRRGLYGDAEAAFRFALELEPENPQYHYVLGAALHAQSRYSDAETAFHRATELAPDYAAPRIALGKMLYDVRGDAPGSLALLRSVLEVAPESSEARFALGKILQREGDTEAVEMYSTISHEAPEYGPAQTQLGMCYLQAGESDSARLALEQAVRVSPYDPKPFIGLGQALWRLGESAAAQRMVEKSSELERQAEQLRPQIDVLRQNPHHAPAHYNLGVNYARFGRYRQARAQFLRTLELEPSYGRAHQGMGILYQRRNEEQRALESYLKAVATDSTLAVSHNNLGLLYQKRGKLEKALQSFETAVRMEPETANFYANLGKSYLDLDQLEQAEITVHRALELDPSLLGVRDLLGDVCAQKGELRRALEIWESIPAARSVDGQLQRKIRTAREEIEGEQR